MNPVGLFWQTAGAGQWDAIEAEIRRRAFGVARHFPRLEARKARLAIYTRTLEKEERGEA
jgi:hypothetical protein